MPLNPRNKANPGVEDRGTAMKTEDAIKARRAVKHFNPDHRMTDEEIQGLHGVKSALDSP